MFVYSKMKGFHKKLLVGMDQDEMSKQKKGGGGPTKRCRAIESKYQTQDFMLPPLCPISPSDIIFIEKTNNLSYANFFKTYYSHTLIAKFSVVNPMTGFPIHHPLQSGLT